MASIIFLETFSLVAIVLGSTVFVLVAVLPTILPRAMAAARKHWTELLEEAEKEIPGDTGKFAEMVAALSRNITNLDLRISDIRRSIRYGAASATAFIVAGLLGLYYLSLPPVFDSTGVGYAPSGQGVDFALGTLFFVGLIAMAAFGASFLRILDLYLQGELAKKPAGYKVERAAGIAEQLEKLVRARGRE